MYNLQSKPLETVTDDCRLARNLSELEEHCRRIKGDINNSELEIKGTVTAHLALQREALFNEVDQFEEAKRTELLQALSPKTKPPSLESVGKSLRIYYTPPKDLRLHSLKLGELVDAGSARCSTGKDITKSRGIIVERSAMEDSAFDVSAPSVEDTADSESKDYMNVSEASRLRMMRHAKRIPARSASDRTAGGEHGSSKPASGESSSNSTTLYENLWDTRRTQPRARSLNDTSTMNAAAYKNCHGRERLCSADSVGLSERRRRAGWEVVDLKK